MSGVVTPPPRPPRPYLPQKKDGLATNESSVTPKGELSIIIVYIIILHKNMLTLLQ